jgi:hypothetical protein
MSTLNSRAGWGPSFSSGDATEDPASRSGQNGRSGVAVWRPGQSQPVSVLRYAHLEMKTNLGLGIQMQTSVHIVTTATVSSLIYLIFNVRDVTSCIQVVRDDGFELDNYVPDVKRGEEEDIELHAHPRSGTTTVQLPEGLDGTPAYDNNSTRSRLSLDKK